MSETADRKHDKNERKSSVGSSELRSLNYQETYLCPVCRHGSIAALTLMEAFACDFCHHIFTADLRSQSVRLEDSSQPIIWRWNGNVWKAGHQIDADLTIMIWMVGAALVILPPSLIWLSSHTFPPLEDSGWLWFPTLWVGLTFLFHFCFVGWLLAEHYQLPPYIAFKVRLQTLFDRR